MVKFLKTIPLTAGIALALIGKVSASEEAPTVSSLEEMKALQSHLLEVVAKVRPATVSLASEKTGAWGSGTVVSKDGRILSAAHVVEGSKRMTVIFPDGTETVARVLGANRNKDTAMLQITEKGEYPFAEIGDSDVLKIGDFLVAMGHAGGHDPLRKPPVRFGRLVSRNLSGFFSSDCTLIGGDSGGPIFDLSGSLVGINSSIGYDWSANNHAGVSGLKADWARLEKGEVWGRLGSNPFQNPDSPILGISIAKEGDVGILIGSVVQKGPAALAGLKPGDIVHEIEGVRLTSASQLVVEINRYRVGQEVKLRVRREGKTYKAKVTLARLGDFHQ